MVSCTEKILCAGRASRAGDNKGYSNSSPIVLGCGLGNASHGHTGFWQLQAERNRFRLLVDEKNVPNARVQGGDGYRTRRRVVNVETCRAWTDEIAEMAECPIMFGQVELGIAVLCMVGIEVDEAIWLGRIATRTAMGQHHPRWSNRSQ